MVKANKDLNAEHYNNRMEIYRKLLEKYLSVRNKEKIRGFLYHQAKRELERCQDIDLMKDVKLRDEMQAFQSPIRGKEIMEVFKLKPGREVGKIKKAIEEAILDGQIPNEHDAAYEFMTKMDIT